MLAERRLARAMMSFLKEVIGVTPERIRELRDAPRTYNALAIMAATLPREAQAMATADLPALAAAVRVPAMLILGSQTPAWAADITRELQAALPDSTLAMLDGEGHEAIDTAPALITSLLLKFFG
jgi:pimeloyl-ACP methyl ester carboxylesterase